MARGTRVPITGDVLMWAVDQSGLDTAVLAKAAGVEPAELLSWIDGTSQPLLTQIRAVASKLHRQLATFLLPERPAGLASVVRFRHPLDAPDRALNPTERRYLRRAQRLQEAEEWLCQELERDPPDVPAMGTSGPPEGAALAFRRRLGVSLDEQTRWGSASAAFDEWRVAVEALGITVVLFQMGVDSCRGFSLWNARSPLIAINTAWNEQARIYTLFHECGHLVTRTDSACAADVPTVGTAADPTERWCEEFAAAVLLPVEIFESIPHVSDLRELSRLAGRFKVSLRAMAIRSIHLGKANWTLFRSIPSASDAKRPGGGGSGRNRREIREDEFGARGTQVFVEAVRREIITSSQALDYLDIPVAEFDRMTAGAPAH